MGKSNGLADAVQAYYHEILWDGNYSSKRKLEIDHMMVDALLAERPEAADGPPRSESPSVAAPVPEESVG